MEILNYKEFWDRRASTPESAISSVDGSHSEEVVRHTGRWSAEQVRTALDIDSSDRVLELGCGIGRIGRELAPHCDRWTGVDISANMLRHANKRLAGLDNVDLRQLTRSSLDMLESDTFDKAYSIAVFCHMDKEDLYLYLQEMKRVLKPRGLIFAETWNIAHPIGWRRWAYEVSTWSRADQNRRKDVARNQFCTAEEFELYVRHAGFTPLANFDQSQSVQIIAAKNPEAAQVEAERSRIAAQQDAIAYSPLYAELFAQSVDVLFGQLQPTRMLAFIDELGDAPEARLFRPYLLSLWRKNAGVWGEPPA